MRNITLVRAERIDCAAVSTYCTDPDNSDVIFYAHEELLDNGMLAVHVLVSESRLSNVLCRIEAKQTLLTSDSQIVSFKYLVETGKICIILACGDIYTVLYNSPPSSSILEEVGNVDCGIKAAEWSPDDELLLLVTGEDKLIEMTREFDVLSEQVISTDDFGEDKPVNVGWGSKQTQFQGSVGKSAALRTEPEPQNAIPPYFDSGLPNISWRADGAYFAVSAMISNSSNNDNNNNFTTRKIRFYSRVAVLQSTSEPVIGLEHSLAWRPEGSIIAATQSGKDVIFFERNGLRRYDFPLFRESTSTTTDNNNKTQTKIISLAWNSDSSLLAVQLPKKVQLWTRNNYHWYLKAEFGSSSNTISHDGDDNDNEIKHVSWHPENPLTFTFSTLTTVETVHLCWETSISLRESPYDSGSVAVIDADQILFTPFRYQNVPPPMASYTLKSSHVPRSISFSRNADIFAVLHSYGNIEIWKFDSDCDNNHRRVKEPTIFGTVQCSIAGMAKQVAICGSFESNGSVSVAVMFSRYNQGSTYDRVKIINLKAASDGSLQTQYILSTPDDFSECVRLLNTGSDHFYVETTTGMITKLHNYADIETIQGDAQKNGGVPKEREVIEEEEDTFDHVCFIVHGIQVFSEKDQMKKPLFIGLAESGNLCIAPRKQNHNTIIASDCTSFTLTSDFLIYTTSTHRSFYVPLKALQDSNYSNNIIKEYTSERRVERGSMIVTAVPSVMDLVLQMPRGNLETVKPRTLVIQSIQTHLRSLLFRDAFLSCRKNRINLNFLHDIDPVLFRSNLAKVVDQIKDVDHLNLLLSNLTNEDTTKTFLTTAELKELSSQRQPSTSDYFSNKVNEICDCVREYLLQSDISFYCNSILTSYACKEPPDYQAALRLLTRIRKLGDAKLEDAVKYLVFLSDADKLFDVALGMYDFELVLLIAQRSQKDPKEFMPFLKELRQLDKNECRFRIDGHLGKHSRAIYHLAKLGESFWEQAEKYITQYEVYDDAISAYKGTSFLSTVFNLRGQFYLNSAKYEEAALSFELGLNNEQAVSAYLSSTQWQKGFTLAIQSGIDDEELTQMTEDVSDDLKSKQRFLEAARVQLDYGKDIIGAISTLCYGNEFVEALRIAHKEKLTDQIESIIYPSLIDSCSTLAEDLDELSDQIEKQNSRLIELKEKWEREAAEELLRDEEADAEVAENVDVDQASTIAGTQFTRYTAAATTAAVSRSSRASSKTGKTAKSRRKQAKNKIIGKKGTVYEESYLIESLHRTCGERMMALQDRVKIMVSTMVSESISKESTFSNPLQESAGELQERLCKFEILAQRLADEVWNRIAEDEKKQKEKEIEARSTGLLMSSTSLMPELTLASEEALKRRPAKPEIKLGRGNTPILIALQRKFDVTS